MQTINPDMKPNKPFLILVEGKTDQAMLYAALSYWKLPVPEYQIISYESKQKFGSFFKVFSNQNEFKQVTHLAIFQDADQQVKGAFQGVQHHLRHNKTRIPSDAVPNHIMEVKQGVDLTVGVFIMPDGQQEGALEQLLLASLSDNLRQQITEYATTAKDHLDERLRDYHRESCKAHTYAYTALFESENFRDSFRKKIWNWEHPCFNPLKGFLQQFKLPPAQG